MQSSVMLSYSAFDERHQAIILAHESYIRSLLPRWVNRLHFQYRDGRPESGTVAEADISTEYRQGQITTYDSFFDESAEQQRFYLTHEAVHFYLDAMNTLIENLVNALPDPAKALMQEQARIALEAATQDLAILVSGLAGRE